MDDWTQYWPQTGNLPNWDAIAEIEVGRATRWLLVEAKGNVDELQSTCNAAEHGGRGMIRNAFHQTAHHMNIDMDIEHWFADYYQFANRLAVLSFLIRHGIPAKLLLIYFVGDVFPAGSPQFCPTTQPEWEPYLADMEQHVGWNLAMGNPLRHHVHKAFIPVFTRILP